jgi:hypothetical protein
MYASPAPNKAYQYNLHIHINLFLEYGMIYARISALCACMWILLK